MKRNQDDNRFQWQWLPQAAVDMGAAVHGGFGFFILCALLLWLYVPVGAFLLAAFVVLYTGLWVWYFRGAREMDLLRRKRLLDNWIQAAPTATVRADRQQMVRNLGMTAALLEAGQSASEDSLVPPVVNVDGTAMVPGGFVDINGNPYGVTPTDTGDWNEDTGVFIADNNSYASPFGMDGSTAMR